MDEELYSTKQVADKIGKSVQWVHELIKQEKLTPVSKEAKYKFFTKKEVLRYLGDTF